MQNKQTIFISYSHKDSLVVDGIEEYFKSVGVELFRDIRRVEYKDSLKEYMDSAIEKDYLMAIVSIDYLKSENCLYEFNLLFEQKNKILPIVKNPETYSQIDIASLATFWSVKFKEIEAAIRKVDDLRLISQLEEQRRKIEIIKNNIVPIVTFIKDTNTNTYEDLCKDGFKPLLDFINLPDLGEFKAVRVTVKKDLNRHTAEELEMVNIDKSLAGEKDREVIVTKLYRKASILQGHGRDNESIATYQSILKLNLSNNELMATLSNYGLLLSHLHLKTQNKEILGLAREVYEELIDKCAHYRNVNYLYANFILLHYNDYGRAKLYFEKELSLYPNNIAMLCDYSILLSVRLNNPELAKEILEKAIVISPDDTKLLNCYAVLLSNDIVNDSDVEKVEKVAKTYEKILKSSNCDTAVLYTAYLNYGEFLEVVIGDSLLASKCKQKAHSLKNDIQEL